jgi:hypothetical protein
MKCADRSTIILKIFKTKASRHPLAWLTLESMIAPPLERPGKDNRSGK